MPTWELTPKSRKNCVEVTTYTKNGETIIHSMVWRWGVFLTKSKTKPLIDLKNENENGIDIKNTKIEWETATLEDGSFETITYPDTMKQKEQKRLEKLFRETGVAEVLEDKEGWSSDEYSIFLYGELELKKMDLKNPTLRL